MIVVVVLVVIDRVEIGVEFGVSEGGRGAEERTDVEALPGRVATSLLSVAN